MVHFDIIFFPHFSLHLEHPVRLIPHFYLLSISFVTKLFTLRATSECFFQSFHHRVQTNKHIAFTNWHHRLRLYVFESHVYTYNKHKLAAPIAHHYSIVHCAHMDVRISKMSPENNYHILIPSKKKKKKNIIRVFYCILISTQSNCIRQSQMVERERKKNSRGRRR